MQFIDLSIIIVSYNTADHIGLCLDSINNAEEIIKEIFVVDNASSDNSVEFLKSNYPYINLIVNKENKGFSFANNQALHFCQGKYIFFLNPDTIVGAGSFKKLISFMENNPHIGLAGPKVIYPDGRRQESISYRYPGQRFAQRELIGLKGSIACVLGAGMICRAEVIRQVGGFDEDFFLYGEDQDLCLRIRKAGYEIGFCEEATLIHHGGQSERGIILADIWKKKIRAEKLFYKKHYFPDTRERIRRAELIKAGWRIFTLSLSLPFSKNREKIHEKLVKYKVIYQIMSEQNL